MLSINPIPNQPEDVNYNSSLLSALASEPDTVHVPLKKFSGEERPTIQHKLLVLDQKSDLTKSILPQLVDEAIESCREAKLQGNKQTAVYVQNLPHIDMNINLNSIATILPNLSKHVVVCDVPTIGNLTREIWSVLVARADLLLISAIYLLTALRKGYATLDQITMLVLDEYNTVEIGLNYEALLWEFYYPLPFLSRPFLIGLVKDTSCPTSLDGSISRRLSAPLKNFDISDGEKIDKISYLFSANVMLYPDPIFSLNILNVLAQVKGNNPLLNHIYFQTNSVICELGFWAGCSLLIALMPNYLDNHSHPALVQNQLNHALLITAWYNQRDQLKEFISNPRLEMMSNKVRSLIDLLGRFSCQTEEASKFNHISIIWAPNSQYAALLEFILKSFCCFRVSLYSRHSNHDKESGIAIWVVCDLFDLISLDLPKYSNIIFTEPVPSFTFFVMTRLRSHLYQAQTYILFMSNNPNQTNLFQYIESIESELLTQLNLTKLYLSYHSSHDQVAIQSKLPQYFAPNTNASISILQTEFPIDKLIDHHKESTLSNAFKLEWVSHQTEGEDQIGVVIWRRNIPFVILSKGNSCDGVTRSLVLFQASIFCHENGLLDDFFMPINDRANVRLDRGIGSAKLKSLNKMPNFCKKIPDLWLISEPSLPCRLYFNYIHLPHPLTRPFFLATRDPFPQLPPITLFNRNYAEDTIIYPAALPNDILLEDVVKLAEFTQYLLDTIFKQSEQFDAASMPFYFAPLMKDMGGLPPPSCTTDDEVLNLSALDWQTISQCKPQFRPAQGLGNDIVGQLVNSKELPSPHTVLNVYPSADYSVDQLDKVTAAKFTAPLCKPNGTSPPFAELEPIPSYIMNCLGMDILLNTDQANQKDQRLRQPIYISLASLSHVHVPRDVLQTAYFMPALLSQIEGYLLAMEVRIAIDIPELNLRYLLEALTPPASKAMFDWDRLSYLGSKFIYAASSIAAFFNPAVNHKLGKMSSYSQEIKHPGVIASACNNLKLSRYINLVDLNQEKKIQTIFSSSNNRVFVPNSINPGGKLIMAIIGAGVATGGERLGRKCMMKMGLGTCVFWEKNLFQPQNSLLNNQVCLDNDVESIYYKLHYSFNNPLLLQEALTSQSFNRRKTDNNLKLAFLGDAVLELLVTSKLLYCYPLMPACYIDKIKSLLVSNNTFSYMLVENFLHKDLLCHSNTTAFQFVEDNSLASLLFKPPNTSLVKHLSTFNNIQPRPPKTLADTFEAIIGSVFVDSKLCLSTTLVVLDHLAQKTISDILSNPKVNIPMPYNVLIRHFEQMHCHGLVLKTDAINIEAGDLDFERYSQVQVTGDIGVLYICQLDVHGNTFEYGIGCTPDQAEAKAILSFIKLICRQPSILATDCQCHV